MKYWYLDSANNVTFLLLDKGFYDYDYKALSEFDKTKDIQELGDESAEETQNAWAKFTLEPKKDLTKMSMDELQRHAINDLEK